LANGRTQTNRISTGMETAEAGTGHRLLMEAARKGDAANVRRLLSLGVDGSVPGPDRQTPLMAAAGAASVECVNLLLPDALLFERDSRGRTALIWAASGGSAECVRILAPLSDLSACHITRPMLMELRQAPTALVDQRDALAEAIHHGHAECAEALAALLPPGQAPAALSLAVARAMRGWWRSYSRIFGDWVKSGKSERARIGAICAERFLDRLDWSWRDDKDRSLLAYAIRSGSTALAAAALARTPAQEAYPNGSWPLFWIGHAPRAAGVARVLLEGADVSGAKMPPGALSPEGADALLAVAGMEDAADLLGEILRAGACDPLRANEDGQTALMAAARALCPDVVEALLPVSDPNAVDANGNTALLLFLDQALTSLADEALLERVWAPLFAASSLAVPGQRPQQLIEMLSPGPAVVFFGMGHRLAEKSWIDQIRRRGAKEEADALRAEAGSAHSSEAGRTPARRV
jgi:ankyrin repeat protein